MKNERSKPSVDPGVKGPRPKYEQVTWPSLSEFRLDHTPTRREKYRSDPVDDHVEEQGELVRQWDVRIAETRILPCLRGIECTEGLEEVHEDRLGKDLGMYAPFVRRRLMTLKKARPTAVYNRGAGYWQSGENHRALKENET